MTAATRFGRRLFSGVAVAAMVAHPASAQKLELPYFELEQTRIDLRGDWDFANGPFKRAPANRALSAGMAAHAPSGVTSPAMTIFRICFPPASRS